MRQVNLVNDQDEIIGQADLLDAHRGNGQKHQAVSLFLFHKKTDGSFEILLQQRSREKIVGNLQWANTLCANLSPGENHEFCLKRRLFEELGINWQGNWQLNKIMVFDYQIACEKGFSENEIDHLFVTVLDEKQFLQLKVNANPQEVLDYVWLDWQMVKEQKVAGRKLTPWFDLFLNNEEITEKIDQVLLNL